MTNHVATLEQWHEALAKALHDRAIDAVPEILVRMARDGWGHEAETARRLMLTTTEEPPSLGALSGHDVEANRQLRIISEAYRRGGLDVLRAVAAETIRLSSTEALGLLLVEAVLALAEHGPGARHAAAQAAADRAEREDEAAKVRRGGGA